jgi:hypothetical protein
MDPIIENIFQAPLSFGLTVAVIVLCFVILKLVDFLGKHK